MSAGKVSIIGIGRLGLCTALVLEKSGEEKKNKKLGDARKR
jgi:predicted ThiF/HesA family dinucleotide-utilizing enzyme